MIDFSDIREPTGDELATIRKGSEARRQMRLPAILLYINDFLGGTSALPFASGFAYLIALLEMWANGPLSARKVTALMSRGGVDWEEMWEDIKDKFVLSEVGGDKIISVKLEDVYHRAAQPKLAGRRGGRTSGSRSGTASEHGSEPVSETASANGSESTTTQTQAQTTRTRVSAASLESIDSVDLPDGWDPEVTRSALRDVVTHRKQIRVKALTLAGVKKLLSQFVNAGESASDFRSAVDVTMSNGWVGVFPGKQRRGRLDDQNVDGKIHPDDRKRGSDVF